MQENNTTKVFILFSYTNYFFTNYLTGLSDTHCCTFARCELSYTSTSRLLTINHLYPRGKNHNPRWMPNVLIKRTTSIMCWKPSYFSILYKKMPSVLLKGLKIGVFFVRGKFVSHTFPNLKNSPFFATTLKTAAYC